MTDSNVASELAAIQQRLAQRLALLEILLDPLLTLKQVTLLLDVCPTTIRRYTNTGRLGCVRTQGNQRRFRLSQVLDFVGKEYVDGPE